MRRPFIFSFSVLFILSFSPSWAQLSHFKLKDEDRITPNILKAQGIEEFPGADAVVLLDFGRYEVERVGDRYRGTYWYKRRIKILTEAGLAQSKIVIPYETKEADERVSRVRAAVYRLNPTGKVSKITVDQRDIKEIEISSGNKEIRFEFPFSEPGVIIEYSYSMTTRDFRTTREWRFQGDIPILKSEFQTALPDFMVYQQFLQSSGLSIKKETQPISISMSDRRRFGNRYAGINNTAYNGLWNGYNQPYTLRGTLTVYSIENVSPLEREPFMPATADYVAKLSLKLARRNIPLEDIDALQRRRENVYNALRIRGYRGLNFYDLPRLPFSRYWDDSRLLGNDLSESENYMIKNWETLNKKILKDGRFGRRMEIGKKVRERFARYETRYVSEKERAKELYAYVKNRMKWDGNYSIWSEDLDRIFQNKRGNSGELNLLLVTLMQNAGLDAYPILIRTRDKGSVKTYYPDYEQFNHVIVGVQFEEEAVMLDVLSELSEFGMLPRNDLNGMGFLIDKEKWGWVDLTSNFKIVRHTFGYFNLEPSGRLNGDIRMIFREYSAATERNKLIELAEAATEYIREDLLGIKEEQLVSMKVNNLDDEEMPVEIEANFTAENFGQKAEALFFLQPMLNHGVFENPFQSVERKYPIRFPCPSVDHFVIAFHLPENMTIEQVPEPIHVKIPGEAANFMFDSYYHDGILYITSSIYVNRVAFSQFEYPEVRQFFNYVVSKHEQDIVFKEKEEDLVE